MERIKRKDIKHDEFVDTSFKILRVIEEHPKRLLTAIGGLLAIVVIVSGVMTWNKKSAESTADELSRAQAAQVGTIALDGNPQPNRPYNPSFESADQRMKEALGRLASAAEGSGQGAKLANYLHGTLLLESGDAAAAVAELKKSAEALGSDPTVGGGVREVYALALEKSGAHDEALTVWEELAAEDSGYPRDLGLFGLARVLAQTGDAAASRSAYEEIVELYPESPVLAKAKDALAASGGQ